MSRSRGGVSTYLQTFILISVALGGAFAIYGAVQSYSVQASGPEVTVSSPSIRQGEGVAIEAFTVSNTGNTAFSSVTILNPGLSKLASYCYSLWNPVTQSAVAGTCPSLAQNPTSVGLTWNLPPGGAWVFEMTVVGTNIFSIGASYPITVTTSAAAQEAFTLVAVPA